MYFLSCEGSCCWTLFLLLSALYTLSSFSAPEQSASPTLAGKDLGSTLSFLNNCVICYMSVALGRVGFFPLWPLVQLWFAVLVSEWTSEGADHQTRSVFCLTAGASSCSIWDAALGEPWISLLLVRLAGAGWRVSPQPPDPSQAEHCLCALMETHISSLKPSLQMSVISLRSFL